MSRHSLVRTLDMMPPKKLVLFGTNRHAICINDYYMFFRHSSHRIEHVFYPIGSHKNRDWWERGARNDRARDDVVVSMEDYRGDITVWADLERDAFPILDKIDFDFICLGNGTDEAHKAIVARYGADRVLFTEYGWLPWSAHFYISRRGAGFDSEIAAMRAEDVRGLSIDEVGVAAFRATLDVGEALDGDDFIYMPLQKDVNDFKFLYSRFTDNDEFLRFADSIVPEGVKILVKRHPLYKKVYDLSFSDRMVDISDLNLNKKQIYERMSAMICLNSTSILEALAFGGKVFSYGDDIYVDKGVVHHKLEDKAAFRDRLREATDGDQARRFVSLLLSRQVNRRRCADGDVGYVARHYWNQCL